MNLFEQSCIGLRTANDNLYLRVEENGWTKCYLSKQGSETFLGADTISNIASRLLGNLTEAEVEPSGEIDGQSVHWVMSLSEAHHTLYYYRQGIDRILLWQDAQANLIAKSMLSNAELQKWREQLIPFINVS